MSTDSTGRSAALPPLLNSLPLALRDFARSLGGDYGLNTVLIYGAVSQAARKGYSFQLGPTASSVPPSLYLMPCAPPAYGKSHGTKRIFAPNYDLEQEMVARQKLVREESAVEIERRRWELADWAEKARKAKGNRSYRRLVARHRSRISAQIEKCKAAAAWSGRSIASDATEAGLLACLSESPDAYSSLILGDGRKLASNLLRLGQSFSGSGVRDVLLNGFPGDELRIIRAGGIRHRTLKDPRLTTVMAVQSDLGERLLGTNEFVTSGLSSRFLTFFFTEVDSAHGEPDPALAATWKELITLVASRSDSTRGPLRVEADSTAAANLRECFSQFREMAGDEQAGGARALFLERAGEQLQRLCLVRALMETRAGELPVITNEVVDSAVVFLYHAWCHLQKGIASASRPSVPVEEVEQLRQAITDAEGEFPVDPKRRIPAMLSFSKAKVEKIAALFATEFVIRGAKGKDGVKRKRGGPVRVVALRNSEAGRGKV